LALQVASHAPHDSTQAVRFVDLAPVTDAVGVCEAVAAALHVQEEPDQPLMDTLEQALRPMRLLLLLDNCEHVALACAELASQILRSCPEVTMLATSREPLRIPGETVWRVPSLSAPDENGPANLAAVERSESARLFMDRALAVMPDFALDHSNAQHVAEICRRLDGIPLALELAAARMGMPSLEEVAERLNCALHVLMAGARTAPKRQHTLRSTIDWSYALLSESERALFDRLAVFRGDWGLSAVEAVCAGDGIQQTAVLDLLGGLVAKSLVTIQPVAVGAQRYRLLEVLRQYAAERLERRAEAGQVGKRCVIRAKTDGRFGGSRTRKTADVVQPKRAKTYSDFGRMAYRRFG